MNKEIKIFQILLVTLLFTFYVPNAQGEEWIKIGENELAVFLYDKSSISIGEDGMALVKDKQIFSPDTSKALEDALPDLKGVSFSVNQNRIDCYKKVYEGTSVKYFDKKGQMLYDSETTKGNYRPIGFRPIPSDTPIGRIAEIVCK